MRDKNRIVLKPIAHSFKGEQLGNNERWMLRSRVVRGPTTMNSKVDKVSHMSRTYSECEARLQKYWMSDTTEWACGAVFG